MKSLILNGYELLTVIIPFLITYGILNHLYKRKNIEKNHWHFLFTAIFAVYIWGVLHFTGAGTIFDAKLYGLEFHARNLHLIPFFNTDIDVVAYCLNVVLFIPFGFILPFTWHNLNKFKYIFISGFLFSLLIEVSQILNNRRTDVDDLILNTLGAIFGLALFKLHSHGSKITNTSTVYYKYETLIYVLVMFLCHFFFFNEFGMAKLLFGF